MPVIDVSYSQPKRRRKKNTLKEHMQWNSSAQKKGFGLTSDRRKHLRESVGLLYSERKKRGGGVFFTYVVGHLGQGVQTWILRVERMSRKGEK